MIIDVALQLSRDQDRREDVATGRSNG